MTYVELRAHTCFSFSDGAVSAEKLAQVARRMGYTHLGITDTADLGGVAKFAVEAMAVGDDDGDDGEKTEVVRPIVGAELIVDGYPAAFLARTAEGYRNLAALVTLARVGQWEEWDKAVQGKQRGRPKVTWEQVAAHAKGLHALTGPATGELASLVRRGKADEAKQFIRRWREVFGRSTQSSEGALSIEVQLHHVGGHESVLAGELIRLAESEQVPWVVTQDPRYVDNRGRLVHDMLTALRYGLTIEQAAHRGVLHPNGDWRLRTPREMAQRWAGREEGLRESVRIAEECEGFTLKWMRPPLPDFQKAKVGARKDDRSDIEALRAWTEEGALERWGGVISPEQQAKIDDELRLIERHGFAGFFLVMADAVRYAASIGILCQGRGSAANSVIAYCTKITAIDPVKHGLLFDRFLSDARVGEDGEAEPPDIDVDFEHRRREEVLDYIYKNYDRKHAAITAVTQCFHAPTAVQDAMRALGYSPEEALDVSKRIHRSEPSSCVEAVKTIAANRGIDLSGQRGKALLSALPGFDGLARLRSTHVGGFALSSAPLGHYLPVEQTTMGRTIVQFDKDDLDLIRVAKFDFLGLGALAMVRMAQDVIEARTGERPDMYKLDDGDAKAYDLIQRGETMGMFQIESRAQINSILHTKPDRLYDIVVQVALIRPGPIQANFVRPYTERRLLERRLGTKQVKYLHPALEEVLERTQGVPIFQEQAMKIAMKLGGYTGGEADVLRRSMGNIRKKEKLEKALDILFKRMMERVDKGEIQGLDEKTAKKICDDLVSFANYGFPESHSWSFAIIAYMTAWLKAHHPAAFFIGLLNAQPMGFYSTATLIHDAKRHGVEILPPCLATGLSNCTAEGPLDTEPALRIGWRLVRGIDDRVIKRLDAAHAERPFTSIEDVVRRGMLGRREVMAFAHAGAFAAWEPDRRRAGWEGLRANGDVLPLAPVSVTYHNPAPMTRQQRVFLDYHAVGLSVEGHPMEFLREELRRDGVLGTRELAEAPDGQMVKIAGLVTVRQRPSTAGGTIFLLLEDEHGYANIIVPEPLVREHEDLVKWTPFLRVEGRVENDGAAIAVLAEGFKKLEVEHLTYQSHDFH